MWFFKNTIFDLYKDLEWTHVDVLLDNSWMHIYVDIYTPSGSQRRLDCVVCRRSFIVWVYRRCSNFKPLWSIYNLRMKKIVQSDIAMIYDIWTIYTYICSHAVWLWKYPAMVFLYTHAFATPRDPLSPGCRKRGPTNCDDVLHGQKMLGPNGIGNTGRLERFEGVNLHISIHFLVFKTEETFMIYERIQTLTCEHVHTYLFGLVDGIPTWGDCIYIYI